MSAYGRYNSYPRRYGGGPSNHEIEHLALLDALAPGWDGSEGTIHWAETYALALAVSMIWAVNERVSGELTPARMQDMLAVWEEACKVPPLPSDSLVTRRARVAAKFRGIAGNAFIDIYNTCQSIAGNAFLGIATANPSSAYVWWRGGTPGEPSHEWATAKAVITVQLSKTANNLVRLVEQIRIALDAMVPSWLTFVVGTLEGGPLCDVAVYDSTILAT